MAMVEANPHLIHPSYILKEGLKHVCVTEDMQCRRQISTNVRVFKVNYGKHPLHLARVWRDMQIYGIMPKVEAYTPKNFVGFLATMNFLRCYDEADRIAPRFGLCLDDLRHLCWSFIDRLVALKAVKIVCPTTWPTKLGASCDGTQVPTNEPRDPVMRRNPKNYAYKNNVAGLNYQIVLSLWTNKIWYANAGDPGSTHDMTAIRAEFIDMVPEGCRVIADDGYTGRSEREKRIFSVRNTLDDKEVKDFKANAKARQEQLNKRLKDYDCLRKKFRHGVDKHRKCFAAVLVLVQYAIEDTSVNGEPLDTL
jgi:DDE superfamily endonuclease